MKTIQVAIVLSASLVLGLGGAALATAPVGGPFEIAVGEAVVVGADGLKIGFERVPHESRCPADAVCIWEGDAQCDMWAQLPGTVRFDFALHTSAMFSREAEYAGYHIRLLWLLPVPYIDYPPDPEDYVATLLVMKLDTTPVWFSTWGRIKALYDR